MAQPPSAVQDRQVGQVVLSRKRKVYLPCRSVRDRVNIVKAGLKTVPYVAQQPLATPEPAQNRHLASGPALQYDRCSLMDTARRRGGTWLPHDREQWHG